MTDTTGAYGAGTPALPIPESVSRRVSPTVALGATVALAFIATGLLIATLFAPSGRDTTVVVGFVISVVGPTILALLTLIRGDHAAKLGASNARKLDATMATVEQVAADVNGHLTRHDELAEKVTAVAAGIAAAAGIPTDLARNPDRRDRTGDTPAVAAPLGDGAPLADQS